jgi:hypothetical protein
LTARGRRDDFAHHVFVAGASAVCTRRHEERPGAQAGGSAAHEGWLAGGVFAQVFLGDLFPGIIGFGRFTASAIPLR